MRSVSKPILLLEMDHSDSVSGLERIEVGDSDPTQLFKQWMADFKKHNDDERLVYMNLATAHKWVFVLSREKSVFQSLVCGFSRDGTPSNRFVLLEDVVGDKFVFFTCDPSRKTSEIVSASKLNYWFFAVLFAIAEGKPSRVFVHTVFLHNWL